MIIFAIPKNRMLRYLMIVILAINVPLLSSQVVPTTEPTTFMPPPPVPSTSTTTERIRATTTPTTRTIMPSPPVPSTSTTTEQIRATTTTTTTTMTPGRTIGLPVFSKFIIPATPGEPVATTRTTTKRTTTTTRRPETKPLGVPVTSKFTIPPIPRTTTTTPTPTPTVSTTTSPTSTRTTFRLTTTTTTLHKTVGLPVTSKFTIPTTSTTLSTVLTNKPKSKVSIASSIPSKRNGSSIEKVEPAKPDSGLPVEATIPYIPEFNTTECIICAVGPPVFQNHTIVAPHKNGTISVNGFCGYPPYNNRQACITQDYYKANLSECEVEGGVIVFSSAVVLLGIFIISANILLPLVVWKNTDMRTQYDYIKVSLAFADMIMGILLITSVLPNVFRIRNLPLEQAIRYVENDTNSAQAVIVGSLQVVSTQASVLHLMFLAIERFTAIKWPLWHMRRNTSTIAITLAGLWAVSLLSSFIPVAFPKYFEYKLQPALLIHMMTLKVLPPDENGEQQLGYVGPLYALFTLLLPYIITVVFCISTGIVVYKKFTSGVRKWQDHEGTTISTSSGHKSTGTLKQKQKTNKTKIKPEIFVFITIIIMIFAFTITLLPFAIVMTLFVVEELNCYNYTMPYVISFYGGLSNSLANAFIYTVRDRKFRSALRKMFCPKKVKSKYPSKMASNSRSNQSTHL